MSWSLGNGWATGTLVLVRLVLSFFSGPLAELSFLVDLLAFGWSNWCDCGSRLVLAPSVGVICLLYGEENRDIDLFFYYKFVYIKFLLLCGVLDRSVSSWDSRKYFRGAKLACRKALIFFLIFLYFKLIFFLVFLDHFDTLILKITF
jgi:hypothetical protein